MSNGLATLTKRVMFIEQFLLRDRWLPLLSSRGEMKVMFVSVFSTDLQKKLNKSKNSLWYNIY